MWRLAHWTRSRVRFHAQRSWLTEATTQRGADDGKASSEPREEMPVDVLIVGAGPAGLSAAIRLKQRSPDLAVCVIEKAAEIGDHILSGNVFDPRALNELIPDWKEKGAPLDTEVSEDRFRWLTSSTGSLPLPTPPMLNNHGNYVISLGQLTRWLAEQAEGMGVEIFPGFAGSEVLYDESRKFVRGVATNDFGITKTGERKDTFTRGIELTASHTLFAEGARGSLSQMVMQHFDLQSSSDPQTYGIGLKEVWEVEESRHKPGYVEHTLGWPLDLKTYGGSFLYHMKPNIVLVGFVVGLDYRNPYLSPYNEFQRFKHHPRVAQVLEGGTPLSYGARVINSGGLQALPKLSFPGGALIGCSAGFLNVPRIKGSHLAIKSGSIAADSICDRLDQVGDDISQLRGVEVTEYEDNFKSSWMYDELHSVRNIKPAFKKFGGTIGGTFYSGLETLVLKGKGPWTFHNDKEDHECTMKASECTPIDYPKPDGKLSFDLLSNLARSGTNHDHDQPSHLRFREGVPDDAPLRESFEQYAAPEQRFCPANVYEWTTDDNGSNPRLQINAQNCVHCKTCDIKTPAKYIRWTVPEGGGGPS